MNDKSTAAELSLGCRLPQARWLEMNRTGVFEDSSLRQYVSPFPPISLMENVSGLQSEKDFASHGCDIYAAFALASPKPIAEYASILDFGCGCGRLARMFKGHLGKIRGCDIDHRHVTWINANLTYMSAKVSSVRPPIPYDTDEFEGVISISIFTHLNEENQDEFLRELQRVCRRDGFLFITVHGERALQRAVAEERIRNMLAIDEFLFQGAQKRVAEGKHAFILQQGHLTTSVASTGQKGIVGTLREKIGAPRPSLIDQPFEYGITFVPEAYVRQHWSKWFQLVDYRRGAIHDFQDMVVLKPKK